MNRRKFTISLLQLAGFSIVSTCGCAEIWAQKKSPTGRSKQPAKPLKKEKVDDWKLYTNQELGFSIRFPIEPQFKTGSGEITYYVQLKEQTCNLTVANNPMGASAWTSAKIQQFRAEVENDTMNLDSTKQIAPNILEYTGWVKGNNTMAPLRGRVFLTKELIYFAVVRAEPDVSLDSALAERFFQGFKVTPRIVARNSPQRQNGARLSYEPCYKCQGRGRIRQSCFYCAGTGKTAPAFEKVEGYWCRRCYGKGYTEVSCTNCYGSGQVQVYR